MKLNFINLETLENLEIDDTEFLKDIGIIFGDSYYADVYNKQLEKDEEKVMVKYVVDVNDMANIHVNQSINGEEEYFYSLDLNVYNHLVAKASNEEEKKEIIIDYFYKRLMDDNFKVYERKIKK